jgi:hypothetical protein
MGTARGMLLLHSTGSRSSAVAFHKAVKEARLKLQRQATALKAAGQLQQLQTQDNRTTSNAATSAHARSEAAGSSNNAAVLPVLTVQAAAQAAGITGSVAAASGVAAADQAGTTTGAASSSGATVPASAKPLGRKSATIGQLARANLTQQSMLFDGKRPPAVPPAAAGAAGSCAGPGLATTARAMPSRGSAPGSSSAADTAAAQQGAAAVAPAVPGAVSPDAALGVMCDALERGMSVPNPEVGLLLSDGYSSHYPYRCVHLRAPCTAGFVLWD